MKKILVVRFDALGDTILTIPMLSVIKEKYPDSFLAVVVSGRGAPALESCNYIDSLIIADRENSAQMKELALKLKKERFEVAFIVSEKLEAYELPYNAGIPHRIGFRPGLSQPIKEIISRFYCTSTAYYKNSPLEPIGLHEVERQFLLLNKYGINVKPDKYSLCFKDVADTLEPKVKNATSFFILQLCAKWTQYGWTENFLARLIEVMGEVFPNRTLIVAYGDMEKDMATRLSKNKISCKAIYFYGKSYDEWLTVMSRASLIITMDTSASHVAAGFGIPCVDIFNEKYYEHTVQRWHPWKSPYYPVKRPPHNMAVSVDPLKATEEEYMVFSNKESELIREILDGARDILDGTEGMPS